MHGETPEKRVDWDHSPGQAEFLRMLAELAKLYPNRHTLSALLGVPSRTLEMWRTGQHFPNRGAIRSVWLIHSLHFAPWKLRSPFSLITWGRYATPEAGEKPPNSRK